MTALYLGGAVFFASLYAITETSFAMIGLGSFAWLGAIQLFNSAAARLPGPVARPIHWAHAMTFELFAFLGVAVLRFIPMRETLSGQGRPILLVHGYLNHGSVWTFFKKRLENSGLGPIYAIHLGHPFRSIQEYAQKVKVKADGIAQQTGRKDLVLIGHSMGGLVASFYATHLAPPQTVTDVITIGSPLAGTPMAHIALGPNGREMEPNSELVQNLRAAIAKNAQQIRFHHIATKSDQLVLPGRSAALSDNNHFIYEDIGHASLLYSSRVSSKILEWITPTL